MRVEEERQPFAERVRGKPRVDGCLAVGNPVRERKGELLHRRRARLADVVARDRDRVPLRYLLGAVGEEIGRDAHRRTRREDVVPARDVLLEHVVLHRAAQPVASHSLLLGDELVEQQQERRRRVDRHRRRHLPERDRVEQELHVGDRVDRDARTADLPGGARVVRVVAELRRQIECDRQPHLTALEQVAETLVRLLGRREAGVLPDRPRSTAVHVLVRPAGERELAGKLELVGRIVRRIDRLDLYIRVSPALIPRCGHAQIVRPPVRAGRRCSSSAPA